MEKSSGFELWWPTLALFLSSLLGGLAGSLLVSAGLGPWPTGGVAAFMDSARKPCIVGMFAGAVAGGTALVFIVPGGSLRRWSGTWRGWTVAAFVTGGVCSSLLTWGVR